MTRRNRSVAATDDEHDKTSGIRRYMNGKISPTEYVREVAEETGRQYERELAEKEKHALDR